MENKKKISGWTKSIFLASIMAAIFRALYLANDTFIMHQIIVSADLFTAVSVYLIIGGWIGTFCTLIYNSFLGKWLDKEYPGFNFGTKKMQLFAAISGIIAAGSTTFCLIGNQSLDPSLVISLSNLSILYLAIYDGIRGSISIKKFWFPALIVILGSIFASTTKITGGLQVTLLGILILLIGQCGTDALEKIIRQRGVWNSDAVTFTFWRFLWLSVSGTIFVIVISLLRGTFYTLLELLIFIFLPAFPWILLTMLFVFFFNTLFQKAIKNGTVSKVSLILNISIILGIPIALFGDWLKPGIFGEVPSDFLTWIVRTLGIILIISGIILINKKKESSLNK